MVKGKITRESLVKEAYYYQLEPFSDMVFVTPDELKKFLEFRK